jgi:PAS domain S-box-containing protein
MSEKPLVRLLLVPASLPLQTVLEEQISALGLPYRLDVADSLPEFDRPGSQDAYDALLLNCTDGKIDLLEGIRHLQSFPTIILVERKSSDLTHKISPPGDNACLLDISEPKSLDLLPEIIERLINGFADKNDSSRRAENENNANPSHLSQGLLQNLGLSIPGRVALLDERGIIVMVSQPWINYCNELDLSADDLNIGRSYLELCRDSKGLGLEREPAVIEGIESVLRGRQETFLLEYKSDLPAGQSRYHLRVERLYSHEKSWILIVHLDITEHRRQAFLLQQIYENLEESDQQRTALLKAANWELHQEIAQRAAAEQEVRDERNRFRNLVDIISHGIVEIDLNWIITYANAAYHQILEYPQGSLMGKCVWDIFRPDPSEARRYFEKVIHEQPVPISFYSRRLTLTGKYVDLKVDWNYKRDAQGNISGFVVAVTDVTQQRRAEEAAQERLNQLSHVFRVFTMNQMVSGLAHELNQPLAAISNFAQACRHWVQDFTMENQDKLLKLIEQISLQADRAGQIIRRLRDFVRRADSSRTQENINDLVKDVFHLMEIEARVHSICLETDLAPDLPRITVDRIQIEQVITNLVKNAMDATEDLPLKFRHITVKTGLNAEGGVEVSVTDTGKGIDEKELNRLFEPFYTTKQSGMGFGLAISRSIVEAHGGRLNAVRNSHRGMTFRFALPKAAEGAGA